MILKICFFFFLAEKDGRPLFIILTVGNIHYLHFSCILFIITSLVTISISLVTQPISEEYVSNASFEKRNALIKSVFFVFSNCVSSFSPTAISTHVLDQEMHQSQEKIEQEENN